MKKVLSVAAMRAADEFTIRERGVPSQTLMERAGRAIADAAEHILRERGGRTVPVSYTHLTLPTLLRV